MSTRRLRAAAGSTILFRRVRQNAVIAIAATTLLGGNAVASGKSKLIPLTVKSEHARVRQEPVKGVKDAPGKIEVIGKKPVPGRKEPVEAHLRTSEPSDPLQLVVSLKDQRLDVYRGVELIESTRVSSGKTGYDTPTGVFSILEKRRVHYSNLYDDAPMPFMQRVTWSGVALHEGYVPEYPASHGCIRLPRGFAQELFGMTERGVHVLVVREEAQPEAIIHEALLQPFAEEATVASLDRNTIAADPALRGAIDSDAEDEDILPAMAKPAFSGRPLRMLITRASEGDQIEDLQRVLLQLGYDAGSVDGVYGRKTRAALETYQEGADLPVTGIASNAVLKKLYAEAGREGPGNARVLVRQNFREIYSAPVRLALADAPIGTHVFTALDFKEGDRDIRWMAVDAEGWRGTTAAAALDRIEWPKGVRDYLEQRLTPGSSIIVTDRSFRLHSGLGTDFIVQTR